MTTAPVEVSYLAPLDPGDLYLTVLTGWDTRGAWDLLSLSPQRMADDELALAIDIATLPRSRAQRPASTSAPALGATQAREVSPHAHAATEQEEVI
jgi:hypothetical protein